MADCPLIIKSKEFALAELILREVKAKSTHLSVSAFFGDPWENRTPVTAVKGRCLSRLTNGPLVAGIGLEPMTYRV